MNYSVMKLKEITDFKPGYSFKKSEMAQYGLPLIKIKSIKKNRVYLDESSCITLSAMRPEYEIRRGDILIALTGDPVTKGSIETWAGRTGIYSNSTNAFLNQRVCKIIPNETLVDKLFLFYWLIRPEKTFEIASLYRGSANQANISHKEIGELSIKLPCLSDQRKIARILTYIDLKTESNNHTNDNLFRIIQSIYNEWFIKYNFPGATGKLEESEIGIIPSGWHVGNIDDKKLTKIAKSGVRTYSGTKEYVATADVSGRQITSSQPLAFTERPSRANMQPATSSVWFAKMENSIKNILVTDYMPDRVNDYIFSTGFMGLECLDESVYYIWCYINSKAFEEIKNNLSTGTLMAGISNTTIRSAQYVIPPKPLLEEFNSRTDGLFMAIYNNEQENTRLARLRDTLLPELINGKIDLSKVEI